MKFRCCTLILHLGFTLLVNLLPGRHGVLSGPGGRGPLGCQSVEIPSGGYYEFKYPPINQNGDNGIENALVTIKSIEQGLLKYSEVRDQTQISTIVFLLRLTNSPYCAVKNDMNGFFGKVLKFMLGTKKAVDGGKKSPRRQGLGQEVETRRGHRKFLCKDRQVCNRSLPIRRVH